MFHKVMYLFGCSRVLFVLQNIMLLSVIAKVLSTADHCEVMVVPVSMNNQIKPMVGTAVSSLIT